MDDLTDLKDAILKILTNEELEEEMGLNAFKNVSQNYTWEKITQKTNDLYAELI